MTTHARTLDRHRFELLRDDSPVERVLGALDGYRNPDGGYGWGLEPDLRSPESQPGAAHHAFEVFEEIAPIAAPMAVALCDWLQEITLADGGLPMALPMQSAAGSAPWWDTDASSSSLQITSVAAAAAHRVAVRHSRVAAHPWLKRSSDYCSGAIEGMEEPPSAYVLSFCVRFADALHDSRPDESRALLDRLGRFVPADGRIRVEGGAENESLHPLDLAPHPGRPARGLFADEVISADLDRLAGLQQADGGWVVDWQSASPAGALEWRGYATVEAIKVLRAAGAV